MIDEISIQPHPKDPPVEDDDQSYGDTIFVVFDTVMFSSSVVTLLNSFVDVVRPIESKSELQDYEDKDDWLVGSEGSHSPSDFNNSVHHIESVLGYENPKEDKAALHSNNGAVVSHRLSRELDPEPEEVIVGSPMNIEPVRAYIDEKYGEADKPYSVILYGAGHRGHPVFEDMFAAWNLYTKLEMDDSQLTYGNAEDLLKTYIQKVNWSDASWFSEEDIAHTSDWNKSEIIPVYDKEKDGYIDANS